MPVFNAWKRFDRLDVVIRTLWTVIALLMLCNLLLFIGWQSAPKQLRLYLPPDLSQGAMIKPEHINKNNVYAFAYQVFTAINTWSQGGSQDYQKNLKQYRNYLSPNFYHLLLKDMQKRRHIGALERQRLVSGISGLGYRSDDVRILSKDTWQVNLHLQILESVDASIVKHIDMNYPLVVTREHSSVQVNPWGLVIAGFRQEPYREKTYI